MMKGEKKLVKEDDTERNDVTKARKSKNVTNVFHPGTISFMTLVYAQ